MIPEQIVDKITMLTLMKDKTISRGSFNDRFRLLRESIAEFLNSTELDFISNNSEEFKQFIEDRVGEVEFSKSFAVRKRPNSIRFFIAGTEVLYAIDSEKI